MGKENLWADMMSLEGVTAVPGRWGFQDLVLSGGAYTVESATELLLHFDSRGQADATRNYTVIGNGPTLSSSLSAVGGASAAFTGDRQGVGPGRCPGRHVRHGRRLG